MKLKIQIICGSLLIFLSMQIATGMETPPFMVNNTNLLTGFPFLKVQIWPVHWPKVDGEYFTVIVTPKGGHNPGAFSGTLRVTGPHGLVTSAQIYSASANKSAVFSFLIGADYVTNSDFDLSEKRSRFDDSPANYQLELGSFVKMKR